MPTISFSLFPQSGPAVCGLVGSHIFVLPLKKPSQSFWSQSGLYGSGATANVNGRAWGNWTNGTKGESSYLDTYAWILEDVTTQFPMTILDPNADTDGDTLTDADEECVYGNCKVAMRKRRCI